MQGHQTSLPRTSDLIPRKGLQRQAVKKTGKRKIKSLILTDTPVKKQLDEEFKIRNEKSNTSQEKKPYQNQKY